MQPQTLTLQETIGTPFNLSSPQGLLSTLQELRQTVETEGKATFDEWRSHIERDRKSTRLNSSHLDLSRMPSSA